MNLQFLTDLWNQISTSPAWLVIVLALNVVAFLWERARKLDNRWIPHLTVLGGLVLYLLLGPMVNNTSQPHPLVLKALLGMLLGFLSWAVHGALTALLRSKFPGLFPDDTSKPQPPTT